MIWLVPAGMDPAQAGEHMFSPIFGQSNYLDSVQFIEQYNYLYTLALYHFSILAL